MHAGPQEKGGHRKRGATDSCGATHTDSLFGLENRHSLEKKAVF